MTTGTKTGSWNSWQSEIHRQTSLLAECKELSWNKNEKCGFVLIIKMTVSTSISEFTIENEEVIGVHSFISFDLKMKVDS